MVMYFVTNLQSNSSNQCERLEQYNLVRVTNQVPSQSFIAVNIAITAILTALIVGTLMWWYKLRNEPRMLGRPFITSIFLSLGWFLNIWVTCIRRFVLDPTGMPNMPCHLHALLWFLIGPLMTVAIFLRLAFVANRFRYTKAVAERKKLRFDENDDTNSMQLDETSSKADSPRRSRIRFITILLSTIGYENTVKAPRRSERRDSNLSASTNKGQADYQLRTLLAASSNGSFAGLFLVWVMPNIVLMCVLFAAFSVYHGPCLGCEVSFELLIAMNLMSPITIWAQIRVRRMLVDAPDPEGVLREFEFAGKTGYTIPMIVSWFLLGFDPDFHDYEWRVSWEWFQLFGIGMVWTVLVLYPCIVAERESRARVATNTQVVDKNSSPLKSGIDFADTVISNESLMQVIKDPIEGPQFEEFCKSQLVLESVRFLQDTIQFKSYFQEKGDMWRKKKSRMLVDAYISIDAPLQVNISSFERERVEKALQQNDIPANIFDPAITSVAIMIRQGAFTQYVNHRKDGVELGAIKTSLV